MNAKSRSKTLVVSNDDLLTEILLRLPVKSILRFKSVSKQWQLLLSHRHFTRRYDNLSKTPGLFARNSIYVPFDAENRDAPPLRGLNFCYDPQGIITAKSCNGLLLCCTHPQRDRRHRIYYVFNPTTNQFAIIPSVKGGQQVRRTIEFMCLAFPHSDSVSYKLVCVRRLNRREEFFQIQVYSSETRKWEIAIESFDAWYRKFYDGVYWNGAVYWPPRGGRFLCFRIDDQQLQTLPVPEELIPFNADDVYFGESRGHLHLMIRKRGESSFNMYEMSRDHSGWFIVNKVELDELLAAFPEMVGLNDVYTFKVVDVVRGEAEEDTFMVLNFEEKIIRYNFHDNSFKQIFTLPSRYHENYQFEDFSCFHRYTETLTSF